MSNLLDKASIILTPTAYDNGKALCVKPSDGSGDFDFSRNSAATRVNAQGLVENVQILSSNLVQNGDFSEEGVQEVSNGSFSQEGVELVTNGSFDTDSDWTKGTGWSIGDGKAISDGTSSNLDQSNTFLSGKTYKVVYTIEDYVSGDTRFRFTGTSNENGTLRSANGIYTEYITLTNNQSILRFVGSGILSITNISVKEVGQDWTLGTGWSIGEDKAVYSDGAKFSQLKQTLTNNNTSYYKVTFDAVINSGQFRVKFGSNNYDIITTTDTYTIYGIFSASNTNITFEDYDDIFSDFSITNISVKEVGQNWDLVGEAELTEQGGRIYSSSGSVSSFNQNNVMVIGNQYKLTFDVIATNGAKLSNASGTNIYDTSTIGSKVFHITADYTTLYLKRLGGITDVTITNISVIEITDDTNLPRINYEGFSYQDALGSEEIVNGDFSNGANNWTLGTGWSVSDGKAVAGSLSNGADIRQVGIFQQSKKYKISIDADKISGTNIILRTYNGSFQTIGDLTENSSFIYTTTATNNGTLYIVSNNFIGSIDNVSVKEYLGQEVVPDSGCGSWLFEPQSTNLIVNSDYLAGFTGGATNTFDASVLNPEGTYGVTRVGDLLSVAGDRLQVSLPITPLETYTGSLYYKGEGTNIGKTITIYIKRISGTYSGSSFKKITLTDNWQRVEATNTFLADNTTAALLVRNDSDSADEVLLWGAQFEQQSYATSYIPTSGSTNTRNQDLCTNGGSLASINSTEGVLYAEIAALSNDGGGKWISLSNGTTSERVSISYENERIRLYIANSSGAIWDYQDYSENVLNYNKIALKYKSADYGLWINGIEVSTNANTNAVSGLNSLQFNSGGGGSLFFGKTKALAVFPYLSDAELTELTTI